MKKLILPAIGKRLLTLTVANLVGISLHATLTFSDDFGSVNIPNQVAGSSGGTGWNGSQWYNNAGGESVYASSTQPTYSGLQTSGNQITAVGNGNNQGIYRYMGSQSPSSSSPTWISIVMQSTTPGSGYAGLSLFNGSSTEQLFIGQTFNSSQFGLQVTPGSGGATVSGTHASGLLSLLVVELTGSTAYLWVDPTLGSTPSTSSADASIAFNLSFDTVRLQADGGTSGEFGNLRFGTTFGDVTPVPEPITLALPLFGGLVVTAGLARRFLSRRKTSGA